MTKKYQFKNRIRALFDGCTVEYYGEDAEGAPGIEPPWVEFTVAKLFSVYKMDYQVLSLTTMKALAGLLGTDNIAITDVEVQTVQDKGYLEVEAFYFTILAHGVNFNED